MATIGIAVCLQERRAALRTSRVDSAARSGVKCDLVSTGEVDAFQDVDLAVVRPVTAYEPECGPDATDGPGHMGDVGDEETMRIGFVAGDANGVAAGGCGVQGGVINAHVDLVVVGVDKALALGCALGLVVDPATGWVSVGETTTS